MEAHEKIRAEVTEVFMEASMPSAMCVALPTDYKNVM